MPVIPTADVPADIQELAQKVSGHDGVGWAHNCHIASIAVVNSGMFPGSRVARGAARGVGGQHSWVVIPEPGSLLEGEFVDPYDPKARIFDPTLWSYDDRVSGIWTGPNLQRHWPKGLGQIEIFNLPYFDGKSDDVIEIPQEIANKLSYKARSFLVDIGAIDYETRRLALPVRNWLALANSPVQGWPAAEIIEAMTHVPSISVFIPIDIIGMLTTQNPEGLYLPSQEYHDEPEED